MIEKTNTVDFNVLQAIIHLTEISKDCELNNIFWSDNYMPLNQMANYLGTSAVESFLFINIFRLQQTQRQVDVQDLSRYFNCNPLKIIAFKKEFDSLIEKKLVSRGRNRRTRMTAEDFAFSVDSKISECIIDNCPLPVIKTVKEMDIYGVLEIHHENVEACESGELKVDELEKMTKELVDKFLHIPFFYKINLLKLPIHEMVFFLYLCRAAVVGRSSLSVDYIVSKMMDEPSQRFRFLRQTYDKQLDLFRFKLVRLEKAQFRNDLEIFLTDKALDELLGEDAVFLKEKDEKAMDNLLSYDSIAKKSLFYNSNDQESVTFLQDSLGKRNFKNLQTRLISKNLPHGINVLFYGAPGTGKTETALQIARTTGRDIMQVDISGSKSKWFGESEKLIKRIFTQYREACETSKNAPILLFNEADAILGKRKTTGTSNVDQTENAMQNILLEEMERMEGILIATTNLTENLDSAFDRRFLHKIEFHRPNAETKALIWKSKLAGMKTTDYNTLAQKFDLTGGQIDNVVRKITMQEVLYSKKPTLNTVIDYCSQEHLNRGSKGKVGF